MSRSVISPVRTYTAPLNPKQRKVAQLVGAGESWASATRKAGYAHEASAVPLKKDPRVLELVAKEQSKHEAVLQMSREKVMNGLMEAVDIARIQAEPATMVKAWAEIARMCGYYAPEARKIDISISAKRLVDKFETMSDDELLKHAEKEVLELSYVEKSQEEAALLPNQDV